jgi:hypothetical protein
VGVVGVRGKSTSEFLSFGAVRDRLRLLLSHVNGRRNSAVSSHLGFGGRRRIYAGSLVFFRDCFRVLCVCERERERERERDSSNSKGFAVRSSGLFVRESVLEIF